MKIFDSLGHPRPTGLIIKPVTTVLSRVLLYKGSFGNFLDDFQFSTKNGTMDHAKFSHHIKSRHFKLPQYTKEALKRL